MFDLAHGLLAMVVALPGPTIKNVCDFLGPKDVAALRHIREFRGAAPASWRVDMAVYSTKLLHRSEFKRFILRIIFAKSYNALVIIIISGCLKNIEH